MPELHCHIEGAALRRLVKAAGPEIHADVSGFISGRHICWSIPTGFLVAYDGAASLFSQPRRITQMLALTYLEGIAAENGPI